jgi:hypothetical protein
LIREISRSLSAKGASGKDICKTISVYRDFRGAPDYTISGGARTPNANAGKNNGCTES